MTIRVQMKVEEFARVRSYLLGDPRGDERAAFLLVERAKAATAFALVEIELQQAADLAESGRGYLELRDGVIEKLVGSAHARGYALIEAHSHPFDRSESTRFSGIDCDGLEDVAPQLVWRLPGRPYGALVFGTRSFDSLYWENRSKKPTGPIEIRVGRRTHRPTGLTFRDWESGYGSL